MKRIFIDSDVILDALLKRPPFQLHASNILALTYEKKIAAATSSVALVNVYYFLNKSDKTNALALLKRLKTIISVIGVGEEVIDNAIDSNFADFEDAVQFYAAKSIGAEAIITRNIKDYKNSTIPVFTPPQFLKSISA